MLILEMKPELNNAGYIMDLYTYYYVVGVPEMVRTASVKNPSNV